eukprot:13472956-Heterocapsa_arctica.AAC.1
MVTRSHAPCRTRVQHVLNASLGEVVAQGSGSESRRASADALGLAIRAPPVVRPDARAAIIYTAVDYLII